MNESATILVVEDDDILREAICDTLGFADYQTIAVKNGKEALVALRNQSPDMIITDVQMPEMDGMELLEKVRCQFPDIPIVLMTAYADVAAAVDVIRRGAADYLVKPFEADSLVNLAKRLTDHRQTAGDMIAEDKRTQELVNMAHRVALSDATVMISGESGSGKEVFARLIHDNSPRTNGPFVAINCAAIPENMLEAVLFGYEKGAYTGAVQANAGKFEQANGGTLLLDEISEMELSLQAKLLRVIQERVVERLGGNKSVDLDVRILATTNQNLREEVAQGRFREDLYYRLNVFPLHLPPLRQRPADVVPLAQHFLCHFAGGQDLQFTQSALLKLSSHSWPGNVRELENVVQRALIMRTGLDLDDQAILFEDISASVDSQPAQLAVEPALGSGLKAREQAMIFDALKAEKGSRKETAARLGISPRTLRYKLARFKEAGIALPG
ncbi:MAG: sigma-54-dependent Fis family transcriptional regulator [Gammaproteobacteria bacterium]|jgi:two-component system, response regulator FlrC|nr:sigma-54-dependent Fis family transcriptional regulator [Gammaproteobacteria bacterium]MBT5201870.1 sigma-54-dependent Fis family transcriptional regulator [Gammaproteobacteria bacterium]MBT5601456.1 sigma-54-dependent Fis family transcriptional regulator [Gammaproteobacteria bacterium]MBT6247497.1 sigma-54-dependent Fis family transcriptional regulator [Gammaproteobacteria bacterium]